MSVNLKLIIWGIVVIILIAVIWLMVSPKTKTKRIPAATSTQQSQTLPQNTSLELTTSATDTSDAALNNDLSVISNQINNLTAASAEVDEALNQK